MEEIRSGRGRRRGVAVSGRDALLDAAVPLFARNGYEGAKLRTLATEAGVDVALVIHHFGSKAALWEAAVARLAERVAPGLQELERLLGTPGISVEARLRAFIEWFVDARTQIPEFGLFVAGEFARPGPRQDAVLDRLIRPHYEILRPLIEEANAAGIVRTPDPAVFFFTVASAISFSIGGAGMIAALSGRRGETAPDSATIAAEVRETMLATVLGPNLPA